MEEIKEEIKEEVYRYPGLIAKVFEDKKPVKPIAGANLVLERLHKLQELAPNGKPIEFIRVLTLKKGEVIPQELRNIAGLKIDAKGVLQASYTDGWCQSPWDRTDGWDNCWGECWDNSTEKVDRSSLVINVMKPAVQAFDIKEFSAREFAEISQYIAR